MKFRNLVCMILVLLISLSFSSCISTQKRDISYESERNEEKEKMLSAAVYLNGKSVIGLTGYMNSANARLPFVKTVQSLGMVVNVNSDSTAHIVNQDEVYILQHSPSIALFREGEENENLMLPPPGIASYYCRYEEDDVFLDCETLAGALSLMGVIVHVDVDYDNTTISITTP